ncbi:MAG: bifunctional diaminohydroxyphosphoribosylaminopyrimidine deaminase/5-amino-6-(5-phosphoribosylamino)uracil reductase RibD [Deltaproteobacteria bacterium]|nr:bifunctional diaminohydroxyphosphoribosylaminopyrimidine deaminase/5-amino-6-(5-phosphoribosylamino)uracil reductase RibD [Deltaproteobacteria bacterium]
MGDDLDERYMRLALRSALKGAGRTSPNPMVGAVVVRGGRIVGRGYHQRAGGDHAEIAALKRAGKRARGATVYLNLEPCTHQGRTPPCTPVLIQSGVKGVVVGMVDPNPRVSGRGVQRLRQAGIQVRVGVLERECRRLNEAFIKHIRHHIPFVILKLAATLDGKIATSTGDSRWVTGEAARAYVHRLGVRVDALVVGIGTVLADDPRLTCRLSKGRDPFRVVLDGRLRVLPRANLLRQRNPERTIVATGPRVSAQKVKGIEKTGAQVWRFPLRDGWIPFSALLRRLGRMGFLSVMIEGGGATAARALKEGVVDQVVFFYAPKIIGGEGREMIDGLGIKKMSRSKTIREMETKRFGQDIMVTGYINK